MGAGADGASILALGALSAAGELRLAEELLVAEFAEVGANTHTPMKMTEMIEASWAMLRVFGLYPYFCLRGSDCIGCSDCWWGINFFVAKLIRHVKILTQKLRRIFEVAKKQVCPERGEYLAGKILQWCFMTTRIMTKQMTEGTKVLGGKNLLKDF